jgi:hypothetical protein
LQTSWYRVTVQSRKGESGMMTLQKGDRKKSILCPSTFFSLVVPPTFFRKQELLRV